MTFFRVVADDLHDILIQRFHGSQPFSRAYAGIIRFFATSSVS